MLPPPLGADEEVINLGPFTMPWNLTGQPAISMPLHMSNDGLPVGVQLVGPYGREDVLIRLAARSSRPHRGRTGVPPSAPSAQPAGIWPVERPRRGRCASTRDRRREGRAPTSPTGRRGPSRCRRRHAPSGTDVLADPSDDRAAGRRGAENATAQSAMTRPRNASSACTASSSWRLSGTSRCPAPTTIGARSSRAESASAPRRR